MIIALVIPDFYNFFDGLTQTSQLTSKITFYPSVTYIVTRS